MGFHSASQKTISFEKLWSAWQKLLKKIKMVTLYVIFLKEAILSKKKKSKSKMSWKRFQRLVNGKRNNFSTKILNYPLKIGPYYTW